MLHILERGGAVPFVAYGEVGQHRPGVVYW